MSQIVKLIKLIMNSLIINKLFLGLKKSLSFNRIVPQIIEYHLKKYLFKKCLTRKLAKSDNNIFKTKTKIKQNKIHQKFVNEFWLSTYFDIKLINKPETMVNIFTNK